MFVKIEIVVILKGITIILYILSLLKFEVTHSYLNDYLLKC